ncbi:lytic transglycosylase domain-containing protein [Gluconobacter kondonii]|uniref:Transglycosylase SLT domain-containing protein n=1 Tax=Gluconobacter kondonii TaxID=941463 RepID=A0ABQ5WQF5_9PROT|nr:lytic transglycosylase domain-containing protein [Gluconobacter kondonii]MBS1054035.1 lytic transglycosylase domain-containing protein [Gluconobacter kondonii]MBS1056412.1 lytic transglycosylase domain-containing protein [Gluconobacter kondonii]MBS1065843.1 lytic transglycosylase domain-containing protein [Gluconobacter kondonii]MBS1077530.1 lytic transglycosylase domain-containing protein [Gluconobacter kondonii]MBS1080257.1 lytic transglycosylase domain-containing protein [Gluconobacter k
MAGGLLACMLASALHYHLPPRILPAIQRVEGGTMGHVSTNTDGSVDIGLMQINSRWILPIASMTHQPVSQVAARLALEPCFNIAAAAMILRRALNEEHGNLMKAIGDYHSRTLPLNLDYQRRVVAAAAALYLRQG